MRSVLLVSVTIAAFASSRPAFAQTPPDAGVATDTPAATGAAPPPKRAHFAHRWVDPTDSGDGESFAHEPGTGQSGPASVNASNIDPATTRSPIAPHLPQPPAGLNAGWRNYLTGAQRAIGMHQTGMAQQSLEMAETRLLDRSTPMDAAGQPDATPLIQLVAQARRDLASGDMAGARAAIGTALTSGPRGEEAAQGDPSPVTPPGAR